MKGTAYRCCQRGMEIRRSVPEISGETMFTETLDGMKDDERVYEADGITHMAVEGRF